MVKTIISKATERSSSTSKSSYRIKIRKPQTGTLYTCDGTAITVEHKYVFSVTFNKFFNKETELYLRTVTQYLVESSFMKKKKPMTEFDQMALQNLTADTLNLLNLMIKTGKTKKLFQEILRERMLKVLNEVSKKRNLSHDNKTSSTSSDEDEVEDNEYQQQELYWNSIIEQQKTPFVVS